MNLAAGAMRKCHVELCSYTDINGHQRTATDSYGRLTCWSTATSSISISREAALHTKLPRACPAFQPDDRRPSQPPSGGTNHYLTPVRLFSRTTGAKVSDQGAISRRYPVVLSRRSRGSGLASSTEAESADKASGSKRDRSVRFAPSPDDRFVCS